MGPGKKLVAAAVRRPLVFFGLFVLLALVAGAAESGLAFLRSRSNEPGLGARWIWAEGAARAGMPITLYAARDFELGEDTERAWLSIAADERYVLWVNGRAIGSGSWQEGSHSGEPVADLYELSDWLETGTNRLVVELRSTSGAGGLLATLRLGDPGKASLITDESWRLFRRADPRLLRGLANLEELGGETPKIWPWPPIGRWRLRDLEPRPDLRESSFEGQGLCARRMRFPSPGAPWTELKQDPACSLTELSDQSLWDFGREVEGMLEMGIEGTDDPQPALLFFFAEEPEGELSPLRPTLFIETAPGAWLWRDTASRRFRYLAIVGLKPAGFLRLRRLAKDQAEAYQPPAAPPGVFGLTPPEDSPKGLKELVWHRFGAPR